MKYSDVLNSFFHKEIRSKQEFAPDLANLYGLLIDDLQRAYPQIRTQRYSLDDESKESTASQFYKYFPGHYFKAYYSLLQSEQITFEKCSTTNFIGWPGATLIDIGCGAGAVSIAFLAIIVRFQQFLIESKMSLSPIEVCLNGVDTNVNMLDLYKECVCRYSELLKPYLITTHIKADEGSFPNQMDHILTNANLSHSHYVLVALSNVVRPLSEMYSSSITVWSEDIDQTLLDEPQQGPSFGRAESRAIESIVRRWNLDQIGILGIATKNKKHHGKTWYQLLGELNSQIARRLKPHAVSPYLDYNDQDFRIINPLKVFWKQQRGNTEAKITYSWGYLHITGKDFKDDVQWLKILDINNLKLAWARARQYAYRESMVDEIELRLFDLDVESKLIRLRQHMLMHSWEQLNICHLAQYNAPKSAGTCRPKTIARLEDQILSAAIIQELGHGIERENSYSYRLKEDKSEFLYEYWLYAWKSFISSTHSDARSKIVLRADIKDFYKNVRQHMLLDVATNLLSVKGKSRHLMSNLIKRDCKRGHKPGYGLPQGHIASGFWADIYLAKLDALIAERITNASFARYADDMFFAFEQHDKEIQYEIQSYAETLSLTLSDSKTYLQSGDDYVASTQLDPVLEQISEEEYEPLINNHIFRLDYEHWMLFNEDAESFATKYSIALKKLSICMSPSWLRRKLHQNKFRIGQLKWPDTEIFISDIDRWVEEIKKNNRHWICCLDKFRNKLARICLECYSELQSSDLTDVLHTQQRRFRFATHRLCHLQIPENLCEILAQELIEYPWRTSARLVCPGLVNSGRQDLILQIMKQTEVAYIRAMCAWSLGLASYDTCDFKKVIDALMTMLQCEHSSFIEKLKASESLLLMKESGDLDYSWWVRAVESEKNPYLLKNYILLLWKADKVRGHRFMRDYLDPCPHLVVVDAIQSILSKHSHKISDGTEPDLLYDYYSSSYPTTETDNNITESPSSEIV